MKVGKNVGKKDRIGERGKEIEEKMGLWLKNITCVCEIIKQ